MEKLNGRQFKNEVLEAAEKGVRDYLDTIRGANAHAEVMQRCENNSFQIHVKTLYGPRFFEVRIKEAVS